MAVTLQQYSHNLNHLKAISNMENTQPHDDVKAVIDVTSPHNTHNTLVFLLEESIKVRKPDLEGVGCETYFERMSFHSEHEQLFQQILPCPSAGFSPCSDWLTLPTRSSCHSILSILIEISLTACSNHWSSKPCGDKSQPKLWFQRHLWLLCCFQSNQFNFSYSIRGSLGPSEWTTTKWLVCWCLTKQQLPRCPITPKFICVMEGNR